MELKKQSALENIDACKELLESMSDALWDHPETGYHEHFAARLYCRMLEKLGFQVEQGLAGIETAFSGTYGSGKPVIGFLGEFDALPYTPHEMESAKHPYELPPVHYTVIRAMGEQMGVGGDDSWGANVHPEYIPDVTKPVEFTFTFRGI